MSLPVAVIGGGYAGMACAVELVRQDVPVVVYERSQVLGGRARLVRHHDWQVDNGQHLLLGAYHELARLLRLVGVSPKNLNHFPLTLQMPGVMRLQAWPLPAPLHLLGGVLSASGLTLRDKMQMMRLMRYLKKHHYQCDAAQTVAELLQATGQGEKICRLIWQPLCVAALNTPVEKASAAVFSRILGDSLGGRASDSVLVLPRRDLTELFPVPAARFLATRRGRVNTGTTVAQIMARQEGRQAFILSGNEMQSQIFSHVVMATAPYHAAKLLAGVPGCVQVQHQLRSLDYRPIITVYMVLEPALSLPFPMLALNGEPGQWLFDRSALCGHPGELACVISDAQRWLDVPHSELELAVLRQLEHLLNRRLPSPLKTLTITEKRATFSCEAGQTRPTMQTGLPGLWLAGDYLAPHYPATLETAVRSGVAVARAVALEWATQ